MSQSKNPQKSINKDNSESKKLDKRYDEKLFKQAYKAAKQAKELEQKLKKRKEILKIFGIVLSPIIVVSIFFLILSLFKKPPEYIEVGTFPKEVYFENITDLEVNGSLFNQISVTSIEAENAVVLNPLNGNILFEKEMYERVPIASLTKIMSVIVTLENFNLDDTIEVSLDNMPEGVNWSLKLLQGDKITVSNLVKAMLLPSYNDAAYAIANAYPNDGYEGFVKEMNRKALQIGMYNTLFVNPSGLDQQGSYSTAYDVAILASVGRKYKTIVDTVALASDTVNWTSNGTLKSEKVYTTNQLYGTNRYIKGLKTGITDLSGPCFVGYYIYSQEEEIVVVVLNSKKRFEDTALLERNYRLNRE